MKMETMKWLASAMPLYCYCQKPDDGGSDMVSCDNPACSREWFHRTCLKLNSLPTCTALAAGNYLKRKGKKHFNNFNQMEQLNRTC